MSLAQFKQWIFNNLWYGEQGGYKPPKRYGQPVVYSLVTPNTSKVWGVDISHWNRPPVNLKRMKDLYGMSFVIIKGHDGTIKTNYFEQHVQAAREAGIAWFIYDWLYPNSKVSVDAQTTAWVNQYKAYTDCSGVKIDAEWTFYAGKAANPSAADLRLAHNGFYSKSGKRAVTYTAKGYADQYLVGFDWSREELWAAHYGVNIPALPSGALTYILHQFTSTLDGKLLDPNGNAELDGNYFNGTKEQFAARFGFPSSPPPELPGGRMKYNITNNSNTSTRTIRKGPGVVFASVDNLPASGGTAGDFLYTYDVANTTLQALAGDKWIQIGANRWLAWIHKGVPYLNVTTEPDPGAGLPALSVFGNQSFTIKNNDTGEEATYNTPSNVEMTKQ